MQKYQNGMVESMMSMWMRKNKIMGYRSVDITSKMPTAQRNFYEKMKKHYKLPLKKSVEEKCTRIEDALLNGESVADLL